MFFCFCYTHAMHIAVGTQNAAKIQAVTEAMQHYTQFANLPIVGFAVDSGVPSQPVGLEQTITGAKNRALQAYTSAPALLGIGLESGLFAVPYTKSGYMDTVCCALYDGKQYHLGLSSAFEYPKELVDAVLNHSTEISTAAKELGFTTDKQGAGMVGLLSDGILTRTSYTMQAIFTAMMHLQHPEWY